MPLLRTKEEKRENCGKLSLKTLIKPSPSPLKPFFPRLLLKLPAMASGLLSDCASSSCSTRLHQVVGKAKVFARPFHSHGSISFPLKKTLNFPIRRFSSNSTKWSLSAVSPGTIPRAHFKILGARIVNWPNCLFVRID